jgi:mevalonate kinase
MDNQFFSKVLLFGEYSVIKGGMGLAIPCEKYFGELVFGSEPISPTYKLDEFAEYLGERALLCETMDIERFKSDVKNHLFFKSNIPFGHGVGSSGALCAALFAKYSHDENYMKKSLAHLQDIMALMESYYHGTSSGLDCLISLINQPVLICSRNTVKICSGPNLNKMGFFYLYETDMCRKTGPLVHQFIKDYAENDVFKENFHKFSNYSNEIIEALANENKLEFIRLIKKISELQLLHFAQMIPDKVKNVWSKGLKGEDYYMKLCGAGGGGFFLVFSREKLVQNNLIPLN